MHILELSGEDLNELILALEHKIGPYPEIWEPFYVQRLECLITKLKEVRLRTTKRFMKWTV